MFNRALVTHGIVSIDTALARTAELDDVAEATRVAVWIQRLSLPSVP